MISDDAAGPGGWRAPDGNWRPPADESADLGSATTPAAAAAGGRTATAGAPGKAAVLIPPIIPDPPDTGSRNGSRAWSALGFRSQEELYAGRRNAPTPPTRRTLRGPVDSRGVFVSLASAVVLGATFLPWYEVTPPSTLSGRAISALTGPLTILDHGFGGWRYAIPIVALLAIVVGVADALIRAGQRGALLSFVVLRIIVLAQLGLVIAAIVARTPDGLGHGMTFVVGVRWPVWGALAAAVVAAGGSLASSGRPS